MQDIGFVHYWWRHDYQAAAEWFNQASQVEGAPWFLRSLAATTLAAGRRPRDRRGRCGSRFGRSAEIDWLRNDAERRLMQLDAHGLHVRAAVAARSLLRAVPGAKTRDWAALVRAGVVPGVPVDPAGVPYEIDAAGRVQLSSRSPLFPLPEEPQHIVAAPHHEQRGSGGHRRARSARSSAASSTSASTGCRSDDRSSGPASACGACGRALVLVREHSGPELRRCLAAAAGRAARRISIRYPIVEALTAVHVRRGVVVLRSEPAARVAAGLRLRAHRAVRDRSRASPAAERHHAAGHRGRLRVQLCHRAGLARFADRDRRRRRRAVGDRGRSTTASATKKASGWAT